jgi:hypothetical protein
MPLRIWPVAFAAILGLPTLAWPCFSGHPATPAALVQEADAIVRAVAIGGSDGGGLSPGTVQFLVRERLKGEAGPELRLTGRLTTRDDFNDRPVPYAMVRRAGRQGDCFATSYTAHGTFLLFLKRDAAGRLTTRWAALQPVNEQLRGDDDPWLAWVRDAISRGAPRTDRSPAAGRR